MECRLGYFGGGTPKGRTDWVQSMAFNPDGRPLASSGSDGTIPLWRNLPADHTYGACTPTAPWTDGAGTPMDGQVVPSDDQLNPSVPDTPPCGVPIQRCRRLFGPPNASIRQRFPRDSLNLSSPLTAQSLGRLCPKSPKPAGAGNEHRFPAPRWWRCSVPYGGHTSHTSPASFPACLRRLQAKDGFHLNRRTGSRPGAGATRSRMSGPAPSWWGHGPPGSEPLPPAE